MRSSECNKKFTNVERKHFLFSFSFNFLLVTKWVVTVKGNWSIKGTLVLGSTHHGSWMLIKVLRVPWNSVGLPKAPMGFLVSIGFLMLWGCLDFLGFLGVP